MARTSKSAYQLRPKLDNLNDQLTAIAAHRYCLGGSTYIVEACIEWLHVNWQRFNWNTQNVMVRDTIGELMEGRAGGQHHTECWTQFARWAYDQLTPDGRVWVRQSVAYKRKPWPWEMEHGEA